MLTLPSLDLHFRLPSSSSVDQRHCTRMMTFTPLGRSLCPTTTSHLKRPLCLRGNFALYSEYYASRQRRTSSDLYALEATSHLTANLMPHGNVAPQAILCLRGNFAPYSEYYASRQCRTSSDLYALMATSHLKRPLCLRGNFAPYSEYYASRQRRTSSDLYALEATWHFKRPLCP